MKIKYPKYPNIERYRINILTSFDNCSPINLKKILTDNEISINNIRLKVEFYKDESFRDLYGYDSDPEYYCNCDGILYLEVYSDEDIIKLEKYENDMKTFNEEYRLARIHNVKTLDEK